MTPFVLVCGLPGSGNRALRGLFQAAGAECFINHGQSGPRNIADLFRQRAKRPLFAVVPVRAFMAQKVSALKAQGPTKPWWVHTRNVIDALGEVRRVRITMVSYEAMCAYPEDARKGLLDFCGLPDTPWPEPMVDANGKYELC